MKLRTVIAIFLALLAAAISPVRIFAETQTVYIADVMVGTGESADEAKKALTDKGYTVLEGNLNEGAGSIYKTEKYVYIGYKTTTDRAEAITDLAVMNMNGGYSFSDYEVLMDKYRDSQIRPFVESFTATIKEYRENYNSENEANKAKADHAYRILSAIIDDDTGGNMGDLLLNRTKDERGLSDEAYKALPDEDRRSTVDLTTALMQGNTQVIFLMEQTLAMAADTNETTWLERLSELGPDGLDAKYAEAGVRPADASREMASLYNDTAKVLLSGWEDTRAALLDYEYQLAAEGEEADNDAGEDSADVDEILQLGVADLEANEVDITDPSDMMDMINRSLESSLELAQTVEENRAPAIYYVLKETPYGEGTMYDFFTLPYAEVSGDNISALYPMASTLTEGQLAAIDFLPLEMILQIGATSCDSYIDCGAQNSDLLDVIDSAGHVSLYLNVNREIFGKTTALTSEALRKQALSGNGWFGADSNLLGLSGLTALSWAATGAALAVSLVSAAKASSLSRPLLQLEMTAQQIANHTGNNLTAITGLPTSVPLTTGETWSFAKDVISSAQFSVTRGKAGLTVNYSFDLAKFKDGVGFDKFFQLDTDFYKKFMDEPLNSFNAEMNKSFVIELDSSVGNQVNLNVKNVEELTKELDRVKENTIQSNLKWSKLQSVATFVFFIMAIVSVALTAYDLYRYYNIKYTPIPKYIVDEADITTRDASGNTLVVRNDTAYYAAAPTNRPENHEQYEALQDRADLNGDAGKEWLALYSVKLSGGEPILADSFRVVTGTTSIPDGYTKGIHMFGSNAAANLTDSRYTYNDGLNGVYVYYKTDAAANSAETASVFSGGTVALVGSGSALAGAALGALAVSLAKKKKKPQAA